MPCGANREASVEEFRSIQKNVQEAKQQTNLNKMVIINGVTAVGKSTLYKQLLVMPEFKDKFGFSVSHTTRKPRAGEENGISYNFVDIEQFEKLIDENAFVEWTKNHGNYYGTTFLELKKVLQKQHVFLDLDYKGSLNIKKAKLPNDQFYLLVTPPTRQDFIDRLRNRGTETEEQIQIRIKTACQEMEFFDSHTDFYNCILCNNVVEIAVEELVTIVRRFLME
ncbi:Guanylate kinase [Spironucleus salmonicida]|uniref:guanylate kinase n=1 Tax=Spironucleus salmonicida TaxID=348837 RepID=V6LR81_9EUKA|nr:Guanylate kinase [Spironucleus salmonicida]|eukprot:EST43284.1 Guanylate kinase [Spironucleus salmonicida]